MQTKTIEKGMELMSISSMTPSIGLTSRLEFPLQIYEAQTPNYIVTCDYATGMRYANVTKEQNYWQALN